MYSTFTIKSIDVRDAANYSCIARNSMGFDKQFVLPYNQRLDYLLLFIIFVLIMKFKNRFIFKSY